MRQVDTIEIVDVVQIKEDGIKIGRADGIAEERKKVIMNLYANDFEPLEISKLLSIPKEEVDKIISRQMSK